MDNKTKDDKIKDCEYWVRLLFMESKLGYFLVSAPFLILSHLLSLTINNAHNYNAESHFLPQMKKLVDLSFSLLGMYVWTIFFIMILTCFIGSAFLTGSAFRKKEWFGMFFGPFIMLISFVVLVLLFVIAV